MVNGPTELAGFQHPKQQGKEMVRSPWGRADLMATAAVRYCMGRSSYIAGDCVDWLIANWARFEPGCRAVILRDMREAIQRDDEARERGQQHKPLGMDMDRREWERALLAIGGTDD